MSPRSKFSQVRISGIAAVLPNTPKSIMEEAEHYGGDLKQLERIKKVAGLNTRYVVDQNTTSADLCESAAKILFQDMNLNLQSIGALIFVSQTPDYVIPFTAGYLHSKLGLTKDCAAFDINLGCSGYVYGLWLASMMIEISNIKNVLLLAGDTISKCVNPRDRSAAPLFGDAGTATLLQKAGKEGNSFYVLHTDGRGYRTIIMPAGGFRMPKNEKTSLEIVDAENNVRCPENLFIDGPNIFSFAITEIPAAIEEILRYAEKKIDEIDHLVFHQANKYILENITRKINFPFEKVPSEVITKYGNQSCASIPVTICDALGTQLGESAKTIMLSGFGVGLSWATAIVTLNKTFTKLGFYKAP